MGEHAALNSVRREYRSRKSGSSHVKSIGGFEERPFFFLLQRNRLTKSLIQSGIRSYPKPPVKPKIQPNTYVKEPFLSFFLFLLPFLTRQFEVASRVRRSAVEGPGWNASMSRTRVAVWSGKREKMGKRFA